MAASRTMDVCLKGPLLLSLSQSLSPLTLSPLSSTPIILPSSPSPPAPLFPPISFSVSLPLSLSLLALDGCLSYLQLFN